MEFFTQPWVIIIGIVVIMVSIVVGNLVALKRTDNIKIEPSKKLKDHVDKLHELNQKYSSEKDSHQK